MFTAIAFALALAAPEPRTITLPVTVITASAPAARCGAPRELIQGSGTVRVCSFGGGK